MAGNLAKSLIPDDRHLPDNPTSVRAEIPPVERWHPPYCADIDMRIARDGTWYYRGTSIDRPALVKLFSRILRKDGDKYVLVTPVEMVGIKVDDAPFVAVEMVANGTGSNSILQFRTNVGDWITADALHPLRFEIGEAGGIKPYIRVRADLWALVTRALLFDLIERAEIRDGHGAAQIGIVSAGQFFPVAKTSEIDGFESIT